MVREDAENGLGSRIDRDVGFDKLDGGIKFLAWDFRELRGNAQVLRGQIIHPVAGRLLPTADPTGAKIAVTVENQQRLGRRRGDTDVAFHASTLNQLRCSVEPVARFNQIAIHAIFFPGSAGVPPANGSVRHHATGRRDAGAPRSALSFVAMTEVDDGTGELT
jgi:hypothetical protein